MDFLERRLLDVFVSSSCWFNTGYILRQFTEAFWFRLRKIVESPQFQFIDGRRISCRGAESDSHGLAVQQTIVRGADADSLGPVTTVFLQLQYIDKVVDVYCAGPAGLECTREGDSLAPTVAPR